MRTPRFCCPTGAALTAIASESPPKQSPHQDVHWHEGLACSKRCAVVVREDAVNVPQTVEVVVWRGALIMHDADLYDGSAADGASAAATPDWMSAPSRRGDDGDFSAEKSCMREGAGTVLVHLHHDIAHSAQRRLRRAQKSAHSRCVHGAGGARRRRGKLPRSAGALGRNKPHRNAYYLMAWQTQIGLFLH